MTQSFVREDQATLNSACIVALLEQGTLPWEYPWLGVASNKPLRRNGEPYGGINILMLWIAAHECGYTQPTWLTFLQAQLLGAQVRRGETGTTVVYDGTAARKEPDSEQDSGSAYRFLKAYAVINQQQIDGLDPDRLPKPDRPRFVVESIPEIDALLERLGVTVRVGGSQAYYRRDLDVIQMPDCDAFPDHEQWYATVLHDAVHATRAVHRLDRDFGQQRFGDAGCAIEELVV